jgi:hypothetical protein
VDGDLGPMPRLHPYFFTEARLHLPLIPSEQINFFDFLRTMARIVPKSFRSCWKTPYSKSQNMKKNIKMRPAKIHGPGPLANANNKNTIQNPWPAKRVCKIQGEDGMDC